MNIRMDSFTQGQMKSFGLGLCEKTLEFSDLELESESETFRFSAVSNSLQPHGL